MIDLAIRNVRVLDGSGSTAFDADVEVDGGRITAVGRANAAAREIDGRGGISRPGSSIRMPTTMARSFDTPAWRSSSRRV